MTRIEKTRRTIAIMWPGILALGVLWWGIALFAISRVVIADQARLQISATVLPQPVTIQTDDAQGITISTEDMIAYCYAHGLEMHECLIVPEAVTRWLGERR